MLRDMMRHLPQALRMNLASIALIAFAIAYCGAIGAAPTSSEAEITYYEVQGNSAKELRNQLNEKGPFGEDGKRADAHADWHVTWNYRYVPTREGCKFTELDTTVTGKIIMPRWSAGGGASSALVSKWQRYIAALRLHENGHYSHGVSAAEEIRALAQALPSTDDCPTLVKKFDNHANTILEKYKRADIEYDADTKHGSTQGAIFP